jgi:hypothetical protein
MIDETTLRRKAREAVQSGKLPNRRPTHLWGGNGHGTPCSICGVPVQRDEIGYELEFAADNHDADGQEYYVHMSCFRAWDLERAVDRPASVSERLLQETREDGTIWDRECRSPK